METMRAETVGTEGIAGGDDPVFRREAGELQRRLGYEWRRPALLTEALTHSSYGNSRGVPHNERLEFLGDAVLDLAVARWLMGRFPAEREGFMSRRRAELVCRDAMALHAVRLGLDRAIRVGRGWTGPSGWDGADGSRLRETPSVLADAMEAVVAALYLDCDSLGQTTEALVRNRILR